MLFERNVDGGNSLLSLGERLRHYFSVREFIFNFLKSSFLMIEDLLILNYYLLIIFYYLLINFYYLLIIFHYLLINVNIGILPS